MESLLNDAIRYVEEHNWYVFPCRIRPSEPFLTERGKEKILKAKSPLYKGGLNTATVDKNQIKEWWTKTPYAPIGVNCGLSKLIVVDVDTHADEKRGFDNWMRLGISDEGALHSMTPSNGLHVVYSGESNSYGDRNFGVDVRGCGAYFIVPPSGIYMSDGSFKRYAMLDDWSRTPVQAPSELMNKLDIARGKNKNGRKQRFVSNEPLDKQFLKVKKALDKLPQEYCDEYFKWVSIGIALKSGLGDAGFELWDNWSQKSDKYDEDESIYKWDKIVPRGDIGLGSIFHYAYGDKHANKS